MVQSSVISSHGKHLFYLMGYLRLANSFYDEGFCIEVICNVIFIASTLIWLNFELDFYQSVRTWQRHSAQWIDSLDLLGLFLKIQEEQAFVFAKSCTGLVSKCQQSVKFAKRFGSRLWICRFLFWPKKTHRISPKACKIYISNTKLTVKWVYT